MADEKKSSIWLRILEIIAGLIILSWPLRHRISRSGNSNAHSLPINRADYPRSCIFHTSICKRHFRMATTAQPDYVSAAGHNRGLSNRQSVHLRITDARLSARLSIVVRRDSECRARHHRRNRRRDTRIIIGFVVIIFPGLGLATLVFLLAVFLVIFGLESIISGIMGRWSNPSPPPARATHLNVASTP